MSELEFFIDLHRAFFKNKKILLGVSGSIAAFKAIEIARILVKCEAQVRLILTPNAQQFVTPLTFETITQQPTYTTMWNSASHEQNTTGMNHIDLARWADLILVAPATANTLAELAQGAANHLLSTEILAAKCPVLIAPAMNPTMYSSLPVQRNLKLLASYGYHLLNVAAGETACGDEGAGRMMEPIQIIEHLATYFCESPKHQTMLISLGPTRSYLDPVRYFTNRSSGKMGAALAFAAIQKGYHVHVIAGPTQVPLPKMARVTRVITTDDMAGAVLDAFKDCDYFLSTAAVLDIEFNETFSQKLKKNTHPGKTNLISKIKFTDTTDILKTVGEVKQKNQKVIGFAAETENHVLFAKQKLKNKNCDAVFVNPVEELSVGFEGTDNMGTLVTLKKNIEFKKMSKPKLAIQILNHIIGH